VVAAHFCAGVVGHPLASGDHGGFVVLVNGGATLLAHVPDLFAVRRPVQAAPLQVLHVAAVGARHMVAALVAFVP
jgi:hypothetical protein